MINVKLSPESLIMERLERIQMLRCPPKRDLRYFLERGPKTK